MQRRAITFCISIFVNIVIEFWSPFIVFAYSVVVGLNLVHLNQIDPPLICMQNLLCKQQIQP